ncbi:MAG: hypothetical protein K1X79_08355 [Oligoflexia bacterium]|nr:hypothetical protein [Oligoflexia bacterium]
MKAAGILVSVLASLVLSLAPSVWAEEQPTKKKELPQTGVLSSTAQTGYNQKSVGGLWGDPYGRGSDAGAPISGSVSRLSAKEWNMSVSNASKDPYSVSLEVAQFDARGTKVRSDSFSYTLSAGQRIDRRIASATNTVDCQLKLRQWKNLAPKAPEKDNGKAAGAPAKK